MQLVMLAGELGEKYGTQHEYYNLRTPADAIKLLCVNLSAGFGDSARKRDWLQADSVWCGDGI
jgi:predicted phage tail protein